MKSIATCANLQNLQGSLVIANAPENTPGGMNIQNATMLKYDRLNSMHTKVL